MGNDTNQWSFLSAYLPTEAHDFLLRKALEQPNWTVQTANNGPAVEISQARARSYLRASNRWLKQLLTLCHLTAGAPARGTEINQVIWQNTATIPRNIYLDPMSHIFLIRLGYSKGFSRNGQEKDAVRALPESISYLLLAYLAYIRPFEDTLYLWLNRELPKASFLLFYDFQTAKPLSSKVLSKTLKDWTAKLINQRINSRTWRQLMQGFIRYGLGLPDILADLPEDSLDTEALGAEQMHHSRATGLALYGRNTTSFQGVRADIQSALIGFSQQWHAYIGLSSDQLLIGSIIYDRAFIKPKLEPRLQPIQPDTAISVGVAGPASLGLQRPVVEFYYPPRPGAVKPANRVSLGIFNEFLSLYSPDTKPTGPGLPELNESIELDAGQAIRSLSYSPVLPSHSPDTGVLTAMLREFLGDNQAQFRSSGQQEAFFYIIKRLPYLYLILPTAAGKTTLFLFGASILPNRVTIIIVPLIALKLDLLQKAEALQLQPIVWDPSIGYQSLPATSRLILVQIEHVMAESFHPMVEYLLGQQRLTRVIWDECHLIPLSRSYRTVMERLWHTLALPIPMIFASATLPLHLEAELTTMLGLRYKPKIIRERLLIKQMAYRVESIPKGLTPAGYPSYILQFLKDIMTQREPGPREDAKIIIFCATKASVDSLWEALEPKATRFYAGLTEEEKSKNLSLFQTQASILLATTAIGAGYDFPNIEIVIHFLPGRYEITNFLQESGRAGRSPDARAYSYCLVAPYTLAAGPAGATAEAPAEQLYFQEYLCEKICRRRVISRVFDSEALESCEPTWAPCDLCERQWTALAAQNRYIKQKEMDIRDELDFLASAVEFWTESRCIVCWIRWKCKFYLFYSHLALT
jgi:superfamily II DNA helicase RecQ